MALPDFKTEPERRAWLIGHAQYFTVIMRQNRSYVREEHKTLDEALQAAERIITGDPTKRLLIYAVLDTHDTFVTTVTKQTLEAKAAEKTKDEGGSK